MENPFGTVGQSFNAPITEPDDGPDPLRLLDFMEFLNLTGRYSKCPHCPHDGQWEISTQDDVEPGMERNPKVTIYKTGVAHGSPHTQVGLTCPNCGHFAQVSTYKIRQFQAAQAEKNG